MFTFCFDRFSVNVLINAAAPKAKSGKINGMAGAMASITRTLGPFISAPVFAWRFVKLFDFALFFF
jgi:hypothetical protein